jgi:putative chitinase
LPRAHAILAAMPGATTISPTAGLLRRLGARDPLGWAAALPPACAAAGISTAPRLAAFLANALHETGGFARLVENLNYSAERIVQVWPSRFPDVAAARPFARNPEALAERVYGGRMGNVQPGDGWRFRGRGLLQTTGRDNYARLAIATGRAIESLPDWLETKAGAAESAARFWAWRGCNARADVGDLEQVRRMINGGLVGMADVARRYRAALAAIAEEFPAP